MIMEDGEEVPLLDLEHIHQTHRLGQVRVSGNLRRFGLEVQ